MEEKKTYKIPAYNLEWLKECIAKLNKKARKLGSREIKITVVDTLVEKHRPYDGHIGGFRSEREVIKVYSIVEITGEAPKYNGWRFIGTLQHEEGGNILRAVPGETIPEEFRYVIPRCDHCKSARRRKDTYVVQHDDGTVKQVGRQCIKDFLGHKNPESLAWLAQLERDINQASAEDEEDWYGGGGGRRYIDLDELLSMTAACIRIHGWKSRSDARKYDGVATVSRALNEMYPLPKYKQEIFPTEEDEKEATAARAWALSLGEREGLAEFLFNLHLIAKKKALEWRDTGIAAALVMSYQREMGRMAEKKAREKAAAASQYFGTVGKREVFTLTVVNVYTFDTMYGAQDLYKFVDPEGNIAVWKTKAHGDGTEVERGRTWKIKATVKAHDEYKGTKQTVLTRCSWEEELKPAS